MDRYLILFLAAILGRSLMAYAEPASPPPDDRFIAGYASAILESEFHLPLSTLVVDHGVVRVLSRDLGTADRERIVAALKQIRGVSRVEVVEAQAPPAASIPPNAPVSLPESGATEAKVETHQWTLFSPANVFQPLISDPRWPNFSAAYDHYTSGHQNVKDVASVSFGESLSLYQTAPGPAGQLEVGIQAAVFAIFNLRAESKDLINADYFVGPIAEYRNGDFSTFLRVFHQSSHLGDEFILDHPGIRRVNLSYEEVDGVISYELFRRMLRIYGGGGYLFDRDPSSLKPLAVQYGVEYRGPRIFPSVGMIPVGGVDMQNREENDWSLDLSARAGVQFEDPARLSRRVQLLLEYYNGHSPNGQFFNERVQFVGLGLHFYL